MKSGELFLSFYYPSLRWRIFVDPFIVWPSACDGGSYAHFYTCSMPLTDTQTTTLTLRTLPNRPEHPLTTQFSKSYIYASPTLRHVGHHSPPPHHQAQARAFLPCHYYSSRHSNAQGLGAQKPATLLAPDLARKLFDLDLLDVFARHHDQAEIPRG